MEIDELNDSSEFEDIDVYDVNDPQFCSQDVGEIYEYLRKKELKDKVNPNYMQNQLELNERNRTLLVDWIVDVSGKFKILNETLFLCINILDRFLQNKIIPRAKFQLVGITALFIACKFEEIFIPEIKDFTFISGKAYTDDEILKMEKTMLVDLDFNLGTPTALHFLRRYSKAAKKNQIQKYTLYQNT